MNVYSSRLGVRIRSLLRKMGLSSIVSNIVSSGRYEARFSDALLHAVRPGDCVWDIGANIGKYTQLFAERVGGTGKVVAVEPSPVNVSKLIGNCKSISNVTIEVSCLGDKAGIVNFALSRNDSGVSSQVAFSGGIDAEAFCEVRMKRADDLVKELIMPPPNVVKIDVEGFEAEVLCGFGDLLRSESLRTIGIEVHFALLESRGKTEYVGLIERMLKESGYGIEWVDFSHLIGTRK